MFFSREDSSADRPLLVFIVIALLVGGAASLFTEPAIPTWYAGLAKPDFTPPDWLFAPVWTALYVLMGVAAARVWKIAGARSVEIGVWTSQLVLNLLWSAVFFSLHQVFWALLELAALWLAIAVTLVLFWRRDPLAGLLFVPYLAWASFALALNFAIWRLNRG